MNAYTTLGIESPAIPDNGPSTSDNATAFVFCGKGLHYDWRAVLASVEALDLDAELADLGVSAS